MRNLTKVVTFGGEVVIDMEFDAWARTFNDAIWKGSPIIQVETAAGKPVLITARNVAYAVAEDV